MICETRLIDAGNVCVANCNSARPSQSFSGFCDIGSCTYISSERRVPAGNSGSAPGKFFFPPRILHCKEGPLSCSRYQARTTLVGLKTECNALP